MYSVKSYSKRHNGTGSAHTTSQRNTSNDISSVLILIAIKASVKPGDQENGYVSASVLGITALYFCFDMPFPERFLPSVQERVYKSPFCRGSRLPFLGYFFPVFLRQLRLSSSPQLPDQIFCVVLMAIRYHSASLPRCSLAENSSNRTAATVCSCPAAKRQTSLPTPPPPHKKRHSLGLCSTCKPR